MAVGLTPGVTLATVTGREGGIGARRAEAAVTRGVTLATTFAGRDGGTGAIREKAAAKDLGVGWPRNVFASAEKVGAFTPGASGDGNAPPANGEPIAARCPFARRQYSTESGVMVSFPHPARYFISARQTSP